MREKEREQMSRRRSLKDPEQAEKDKKVDRDNMRQRRESAEVREKEIEQQSRRRSLKSVEQAEKTFKKLIGITSVGGENLRK